MTNKNSFSDSSNSDSFVQSRSDVKANERTENIEPKKEFGDTDDCLDVFDSEDLDYIESLSISSNEKYIQTNQSKAKVALSQNQPGLQATVNLVSEEDTEMGDELDKQDNLKVVNELLNNSDDQSNTDHRVNFEKHDNEENVNSALNLSFYLDEFDDFSEGDDDKKNEVALDGAKLHRRDRAVQVALLLKEKYDCSEQSVELLSEKAVEFQLIRGMNDVELELAIYLRDYWESFSELSQSSGRYVQPSLNWDLALKLVRAFNSYPDKTELEDLISKSFQVWKESFRLQDEYRSFKDYLSIACGSSFSQFMVAPDLSLGDSGFYKANEDDFTCGPYVGKQVRMMQYEYAYVD